MGNRRDAEYAEDAENCLTARVIGAAVAVHRELGPGLLEALYAQCLQIELDKATMACSFGRTCVSTCWSKGV